MSSEYSVVAYSAEHRPAVLALHALITPRRRGHSDRYLRWKYEENPFLDRPHMALVLLGGEVVGLRALCGARWATPDGRAVTMPGAEDLVIHPNHRDRGLFLMIDKAVVRQAADQGYSRVVSLSAGRVTRELQRVTGWRQLSAPPAVRRIARRLPVPLVRRVAGRTRRTSQRIGLGLLERPSDAKADRLLDRLRNSSPVIELSAIPDFDAMVRLSPTPSATYRPERSETFYRWRLNNPDRRYRYLYWRDREVRGFLTLALMPSDHRLIRVADSGAQTAEILTEMLTALAGATGVTIELLSPSLPFPMGEEFLRLGFKPLEPAGQLMTVYGRTTARSPGGGFEADERWNANLIDSYLA